jgi:hypothetical protein
MEQDKRTFEQLRLEAQNLPAAGIELMQQAAALIADFNELQKQVLHRKLDTPAKSRKP